MLRPGSLITFWVWIFLPPFITPPVTFLSCAQVISLSQVIVFRQMMLRTDYREQLSPELPLDPASPAASAWMSRRWVLREHRAVRRELGSLCRCYNGAALYFTVLPPNVPKHTENFS